MFDVNGNTITVSRQDVGAFTVTFTGNDAPQDGTEVLVTLKEQPKKYAPTIWQKKLPVVDGKITVNINTEDSDLPPGEYFWDVRILYENDEPYTPMTPASYVVLGVVGDV